MIYLKMKRVVLLIPAFLLFFGCFTSKSSALSFPSPSGYVNDFANVINQETKSRLETKLAALEKDKGIQFTVATVTSLQGTTIEDYAVRLFENWQIGKKGKDDGLLLLVSSSDRKVRFEVGYGLEPVLTDAGTGRILDTFVLPKFKEGNYGEGIEAGVDVVIGTLSGTLTTPPEVSSGRSPISLLLDNLQIFIIVFVVLLQYFGSFLARSKSFWGGGVIGLLLGAGVGLFYRSLTFSALAGAGLGLFGLLLDYVLSKNYDQLKKLGKSTGFRNTWGGFSRGGGGGGSGFGGFGGGRSGGGGSSRSW